MEWAAGRVGVETSTGREVTPRCHPQRRVWRRRELPQLECQTGRAVRSQRASIRKTGEALQIFPPATSSLPSLRPEMRKRVTQGDLRRHSDHQPSGASRSVNLFLPRRPRGAYFVVLSSVACKVGQRIRQRGSLLVGIIPI